MPTFQGGFTKSLDKLENIYLRKQIRIQKH